MIGDVVERPSNSASPNLTWLDDDDVCIMLTPSEVAARVQEAVEHAKLICDSEYCTKIAELEAKHAAEKIETSTKFDRLRTKMEADHRRELDAAKQKLSRIAELTQEKAGLVKEKIRLASNFEKARQDARVCRQQVTMMEQKLAAQQSSRSRRLPAPSAGISCVDHSENQIHVSHLVCHEDAGANNIFFKAAADGTASNEIGAFIDWQIAFKGNPMHDICRILYPFCDVEVRRDVEATIVREYYNRLATETRKMGLTLSFNIEQLREAYALAAVHQTMEMGIRVVYILDFKKDDFSPEVLGAWKQKLEDHDGFIERGEMRSIVRELSLGRYFPDHVIEQLFNEADIDGDGKRLVSKNSCSL